MRTPNNVKATKWYRHPNFVRPKINHRWTKEELEKIYTLRKKGLGIDEIISRTHLSVGKIQIYNVLRRTKKSKQHKCFQCSSPLTKEESAKFPHNPLKSCDRCREKSSVYKEGLRKNRKKSGLCICCGKKQALEDRTTCKSCLSAPYRNRIVKGFCGVCGDRPIDKAHSISMCPRCLKANRSKATQYRKESISCK